MNQTLSSRHWQLKEQACSLRSQGLSYREIVGQLGISKSTVSLWCRYVPLTLDQREILQDRRGTQMNGIRIAHTMFWKKRCDAFWAGVEKMERLITNPEFVAGVMLYWAEGNKQRGAALANSDADVIRFIAKWFTDFFQVTPDHMSIHMHLHTGQSVEVERAYWSGITGVPEANFQKPFFKPEGSGYRKNVLYHGTVNLHVKEKGSTYKLFEILGCIAGFQKMVLNKAPRPEEWMDKSQYAADSIEGG